MKKRDQRFITFALFALAFIGVFVLAANLAQSTAAQELVAQFGYVGVVGVAVIAGLNAIFPVPAATLTPIFEAAGLSLPLVIIALTAGTLIADFVGFFFGRVSRSVVEEKYPKVYAFFINLRENHQKWLLPVVMFYAAFVPFPNEAILIPLGVTGIKFKKLVLPLILGNMLNQTLLVYGFSELAGWLF